MPGQEPSDIKVLIVDDIPENRRVLEDTLEPRGYNILLAANGDAAIKVAQRAAPDVILLDVMMPGIDGFETCRRLKADDATREIPVIFITAKDEVQCMVSGFEVGAVDYIAKPFQAEEVLVRVNNQLKIHRLTRELREKNAALEAEITRRQAAEQARDESDEKLSLFEDREAERWGVSGWVGQSLTFRKILDAVRRVANFDASRVLITGESGTGKELIARAIHHGSRWSKGAFIPVNCSAIPGDLAESLLFGHLKGSFTGAATDRKGCFELAHEGTLFLDEIGEMPAPLQVKLLRVLEDGEVIPLGGTKGRKVRAQVLAATNADLRREMEAGRFREDLYFRLAMFVVEVPPLRERREDIPLLVDHFARILSEEMGLPKPPVSPEAGRSLIEYDYPGNIRELRNILERALMESEGEEIRAEHLHYFRPGRGGGQEAVGGNGAALAGGLPEPAEAVGEEAQVLALIRERGVTTNGECRELLKTDRHHASYLLRKMAENGRLRVEGHGRWAQYRLPRDRPHA